jgi:hypothetical protein
MITATTIIATTITVMHPRPFALTVTIRMPLTHAPHMDTGDQITSLTVYSSAPDLGTAAVGAAATTGVADTMAEAGMAGEVITDAEVMAAVDVAGTAVDVAGTAAVDTGVAAILQEDMADTAAADAAGMVAVDTGVAAILQEDMADTAAVDVADMAAVDAGTVVAVDVAGINPVEAVSMGVEEDSVAVEEAVSTVAAVDRTAAVVEEAVSTVAVVDRTAAVADTKSAISLNLEERLAIPASFFA